MERPKFGQFYSRVKEAYPGKDGYPTQMRFLESQKVRNRKSSKHAIQYI